MARIGQFQPGDIVACYARDWASRSISLGTLSLLAPTRRLILGPSHVAIVCQSPAGDLYWVESTTFCKRACAIRGERVQGVQAHRPEERVIDYLDAGGRCDIYRLSEIDALREEESVFLTDLLLNRFVRENLSYDLGGALISGTRLLRFSKLLYRLACGGDLKNVFCSELIAAVLQRCCRMNRDNPSKYNPGRLVRRLVSEGTYGFVGEAVPLLLPPASLTGFADREAA